MSLCIAGSNVKIESEVKIMTWNEILQLYGLFEGSQNFTDFKVTWILSFELQQTFTRLAEAEGAPTAPPANSVRAGNRRKG